MNVNSDLVYLKNKFHSKRLCISKKFHKKLLQYAHDEHVHGGIHRTYDLLSKSVYMPKMKKLINEYVTTCSICQFSKFFKLLPYDQFQSIFLFSELLSELNMNFIVGLSFIFKNSNVIFTVTNRFSKYVKLIPEREIMSTKK